MTIDQRNRLLSRIIADYCIIYINNEKYIIKRPTRDIIHAGQLEYEKILQCNKFNRWMSENECLVRLARSGQWPMDGDKKIENLEEASKTLKIELYRSILQPDKVKILRKQLQQVTRAIDQLYEIKHSLDLFTVQGFANLGREYYILSHTIYTINDKLFSDLYEVSSTFLDKVRYELSKQVITISEFRELARTNPWRLYWGISDNPFDKSVVDLDGDKRTLIAYSKMYDNIYENVDCPNDDVINDDDMLDGWMLLQKKDRDEKKKEKTIDSTINNLSPKYQRATEIFLPAKSVEEAQQINELNSPRAKMVKKQRKNILNQREQVKHENLPDVMLDKQMMAHEQMKHAIKR